MSKRNSSTQKKSKITSIKFPNGAKVRTFLAPPSGFNPLKADHRQLLKHGFPRRPEEHPELMKHWEKVLSQSRNYINPSFRRNENKKHGRRLKTKNSKSAGTESSDNWSGAVVFAPSGTTMTWIYGEWTVPNPYPIADDGTWYYSTAWIGIDGDGSNDVFQAGVECEAITSGGVTQRNIYPWWEWAPDFEIAIDNFPVSAGDVMHCLLCVTSNTTGIAFYTNQSSGAFTSFELTAPSGTMLVGNCAEWIMERPQVGGVLSNLANYGVCYFDTAMAASSGGDLLGPSDGDIINMTDNS